MPTFLVTDPDTGRQVRLTGDSPPSEAELETIFSQLPGVQDAGAISGDIAGNIPRLPIAGEDTRQVEQPLMDRLNEGFAKIPGVPALAEFAAAANRSVVDFVDFLGPDTVNAVLSLAGTDVKVPTLREALKPTGIEGGFVEEGLGRDVLRAAGETAPLALGVGQVLRTLASRLPALATGGESVTAGVTRQIGQVTAGQDIALGSIAGAGGAVGGDVGEEVGGEEGRQIGETVGATLAPISAIPLSIARESATKLLREATPSVDAIKRIASAIYKSLDESGVRVEAEKFGTLADDIVRTLNKEGADKDLTPAANAVIRRFTEEKGATKTLSEIDTLRKVAKGAADSIDRNESRLGTIAIKKVDDFLDSLGGEVAGKETGEAFRSARDLWGRVRRTELLEQAVDNARLQASGVENGIRTQFRSIAKRITSGKLQGFSKDEQKAIEGVATGTRVRNVARFLGKFGVLDGVTSRTLTTLAGASAVGAATQSTEAALIVPLIGQVSGALAERLTKNSARMAMNIIRAGKNGPEIARIYAQNTPKKARNSNELAELLLKNEVPLERINLQTSNPLLANAAIIAAVAQQNDLKEE